MQSLTPSQQTGCELPLLWASDAFHFKSISHSDISNQSFDTWTSILLCLVRHRSSFQTVIRRQGEYLIWYAALWDRMPDSLRWHQLSPFFRLMQSFLLTWNMCANQQFSEQQRRPCLCAWSILSHDTCFWHQRPPAVVSTANLWQWVHVKIRSGDDTLHEKVRNREGSMFAVGWLNITRTAPDSSEWWWRTKLSDSSGGYNLEIDGSE